MLSLHGCKVAECAKIQPAHRRRRMNFRKFSYGRPFSLPTPTGLRRRWPTTKQVPLAERDLERPADYGMVRPLCAPRLPEGPARQGGPTEAKSLRRASKTQINGLALLVVVGSPTRLTRSDRRSPLPGADGRVTKYTLLSRSRLAPFTGVARLPPDRHVFCCAELPGRSHVLHLNSKSVALSLHFS